MTAAPAPTDPNAWFRRLGFVPTPNPGLPLPKAEEIEKIIAERPEEFAQFLRQREERIAKGARDPLRHGYEPQIWHVVDDLLVSGKRVVLINPVDGTPREIIAGSEVYISGANRSSKSQYAARTIMKRMVERRQQRGWCFHATGPRSLAQQQPRLWQYMPPEWKAIRKHPLAYIRYKPATGFSGEPPTFIGPNGSQCWFMNYAMDVGGLEGDEIDIAWMTELVPFIFIEAVRFRLAQRSGVLILDFTPAGGYTPTVGQLIDKAVDVIRVPAPLLPKPVSEKHPQGCELVPRVQRADPTKNPSLSIVYFHLSDNPFANAAEVIKKAKAGGRKKILERVYGVAEKLAGNLFPTFNRSLHVISEESWQKIAATQKRTTKHYLDPCSGRNWFMLWASALDDDHTIVVHREWPCPGVAIRGIGDPGWWAEFDANKPDGKKGDAQMPWGFSLERYFEEILFAEGWSEEEIEKAKLLNRCDVLPLRALDAPHRKGRDRMPERIFERLIDSRFGNAPTVSKSEAKTLIESMADIGMPFEPAPGEFQQEGIDQIHNLLFYDDEKPIDTTNRPRLLIVESCQNTIWTLENYTGADGQKGASKEAYDLLRYMALSPPEYFPEERMRARGGGSY